MLQQLLHEANERQEELSKKHLATYRRMLHLESLISTLQQGGSIGEFMPSNINGAHISPSAESTGVFIKKRDQPAKELQIRAELEAELIAGKDQLQKSQREPMTTQDTYGNMPDVCSDHLAASSPNAQKIKVLTDDRKRQSATLTDLQSENNPLQKQSTNVRFDINPQDSALTAALESLKMTRASGDTTKDSVDALQQRVSGMAKTIMDGRKRLAKYEEVHKSFESIHSPEPDVQALLISPPESATISTSRRSARFSDRC